MAVWVWKTNLSALRPSRRSAGSSTSRSLLSQEPSVKTRGYFCIQLLGVFVCSWSEIVKSHSIYVLKLQGSLTTVAFPLGQLLIEPACFFHSPKVSASTVRLATISSLTVDARTESRDLEDFAWLCLPPLHAAPAFCGVLPITLAPLWFVCLPSIAALMPLSILQPLPPQFDSTLGPVIARIQCRAAGCQTRNPCSTPVRTISLRLRFLEALCSLFFEWFCSRFTWPIKLKDLYVFCLSGAKSDVKTLLLFSGNSLL